MRVALYEQTQPKQWPLINWPPASGVTYQPGLKLLPQHLALRHGGLGLESHRVLLLQSNHARHVSLYAWHHAGVAGSSVHHLVDLWIARGSVRWFQTWTPCSRTND